MASYNTELFSAFITCVHHHTAAFLDIVHISVLGKEKGSLSRPSIPKLIGHNTADWNTQLICSEYIQYSSGPMIKLSHLL